MTTAALLTRLQRNKEVFTALGYQVQERRLEHVRLVERLLALTRTPNRQRFDVLPPPIPLWRFTRVEGVRWMVPLPTIRGGREGSRDLLFHCTPQPLDGVTYLVLSGDLDLSTVATFQAHLKPARDVDGLLLDLRDLRYIDSTGINALLNAHRIGRRIVLVGPSPNVRRILSVLHIEDLVPVFASLDEALEYLRSNGGSQQPFAGA